MNRVNKDVREHRRKGELSEIIEVEEERRTLRRGKRIERSWE